jgi:hypothetical protein
LNPTGRKPRLSHEKPEKRKEYRDLIGKPAGRRPLGRPRRGWEHIKMDFREIGLGGMDWFHLVDSEWL